MDKLWFLFAVPIFVLLVKKITEGNEDFTDRDIGKTFLVVKAKQDTIKVQHLNQKPLWYNKPETNNNIRENVSYILKTSNNKLYLEEELL